VTVDSGRRWTEPRMNLVDDIVCPSTDVCLAGGSSGVFSGTFSPVFSRAIALTTDRGGVWRRVTLPNDVPRAPSEESVRDIECPAADRCVATSNVNGTITILTLTTTDGWQTVAVTESDPI
jgi:hypothetical protein